MPTMYDSTDVSTAATQEATGLIGKKTDTRCTVQFDGPVTDGRKGKEKVYRRARPTTTDRS